MDIESSVKPVEAFRLPIEKKRSLRSLLGFSDESRFSALLTAPARYTLFFIIVFPLLTIVYISMTSWTPTSGGNWWDAYRFWDWGQNYVEVAAAPDFWKAVLRTFLIVGVAVPLEFLLGLGLAFLFLNEFPGKSVFHTILLIPMMIVPAVTGYMFYMIFQSNGPLNGILTLITGTEVVTRWLVSPPLAIIAVILADVWQWTPLMFLIMLSGLVGVPEDQMRAATILGANFWQKFRLLMLPLMKPVIVIALVIRFMEAFKMFDSVFLMTAGGPARATETVSIYMYREAFQNIRWSYTAAAALIILVLVTIIASYALKPLQSPTEAINIENQPE
jgi:multiple sugar transport system permease protein